MTKEVDQMSEMQRELLNRADVIFQKIAEAASKAADFTNEQLPDIVYQFIAYNRTYITSCVVVAIILFCISLWVITIGVQNKWRDVDKSAFCILGGGVLFVISLVTFLSNFKSFMMVWFAPKLFLITEIAQLVKAMK